MNARGFSPYSRICLRQLLTRWTNRSVRNQFNFSGGAGCFAMFIHRTPRFRVAKVFAFVHIFLACVSLPVAVSDHHSVASADHPGSARRVSGLSFRILEGSGHGGLPTEPHSVHHRRSHHHHAGNKDENYVLRRMPVSSGRRVQYRQGDVNASHIGNENINLNLNTDSNVRETIDEEHHPVTEIDYRSSTKAGGDSAVTKLEDKLYSGITFRANMIKVFGQILNAPNNRLTVDQFTSLNLILQTLIHKQVYTFNMLPILKKLQSANEETQFKLVMQALANNVPVYMASACKFWVNEIDKHRVNVKELIGSIKQPADFLAGLDSEVIDTCKVKVAAEELEPFDKPSEVTRQTLGPVFVNIFNKMKNHQITLSQKLFGAILMNLPVGKLNPVLEENVNYIWDVMRDSLVLNWDKVATGIEYGNPYEVVGSVAKKLVSKRDTPDVLRQAFKYILLHLKEVPSTYSDEYYPDMQALLHNDRNLELLLAMIQDDYAIPELGELRNRMITLMKEINIDDILRGMNKYAYQEPIDLLLALLTRIRGRTQNKDIRDTVTKLLSILISKEELGSFTVTIPADVDLVMLLDFLNVPDSDPAISALGQKIQNYFEGDLNLLISLQNLALKVDKSKCHRPIQCLVHFFMATIKPETAQQLGVSPDLLTMIRKLVDLIVNAINSSSKCESHDVMSFEHDGVLNSLLNAVMQSISQPPGSTVAPVTIPPSKPTELPEEWPIQQVVSTDYDEAIFKPDYPESNSDEVGEIIYPTYPDEQLEILAHPTLPVQDVKLPDGWIVKPIEVELPELKPDPTLIPQSVPKPMPTVITTSIPQIIQTSKPPVAPSVRPIIEPSIPPPISSSTEPPRSTTVSTTPDPPRTKPPPTTERPNNSSPQSENEPVLPPNLSYDRPLYVVFPKRDGPPYTTPTKPTSTHDLDGFIHFPSIKELLQGFDPTTPFTTDELPNIPEILEPIEKILGPNYIEELLGRRVNKAEYPTVISLVDDVLDHALENPKVAENPKLALSIRRYLKGIDYLSTTALFPVVVDSQKIPSDVLHVTFDPDNPNANSVDSEPPGRMPAGFMTLPIYHPKYWKQQVDPANPYGTLLPSGDASENNPIQELENDGSLQEILGPKFDPLLYPNRGTLLTSVLQKLIVSEHVKSDPWLLKKFNAYLKSIRTVALYSKIPNDYDTHILAMQQNNEVNWKPDTASLIMALPPARSQHQSHKLQLIKAFLETPNLLESLQIDTPSYSTTRGTLLKMIFNSAIRGKKVSLDPQTLTALKYYEHKILTKGQGALPIIWVWVQMFIIREEVPLGEIIEAVLDYDSLPRELKISYNDLMTYLSDNPQLLQGNDNFAFEKYQTKGTFLKGLFTHFLSRSDTSRKAKSQFKQLIPYINLTGRGAEPMKHITIDDITNGEIDENGFPVLLNGYKDALAVKQK